MEIQAARRGRLIPFNLRFLVVLDTDRRLTMVSKATGMVWCQLVRLIHRHGDGGLSLRMDAALGSMSDLAKLLDVTPAELEAHITALVARELLTRTKDGVLGLPVALMPTPHEIANRVNGLKGGRPRKRLPGDAAAGAAA